MDRNPDTRGDFAVSVWNQMDRVGDRRNRPWGKGVQVLRSVRFRASRRARQFGTSVWGYVYNGTAFIRQFALLFHIKKYCRNRTFCVLENAYQTATLWCTFWQFDL